MDFLKQKLSIPSWLVFVFMGLSILNVNYGFVYFLLLFLGVNKYATENIHDGKNYGIPLIWPPWLRKSSEIVFWVFTALLAIGAWIQSNPDVKEYIFTRIFPN